MAVVLFDMFPAQGHYNGSFGLAQLLKNAGHKVCFAGPAEFHEKILALGFPFYLFNPFIIQPFSAELKEKGLLRFLIENWAGIFTNEKKKQIEDNIQKYDEMIEKINPDLIILDEHYAYKSIFYWKYKRTVVTIQTAISPDYAPGIPPFNFPYVPDFSKKSRIYVTILWRKLMLGNRIRKFINNTLTVGNTSDKYYRRYAKKYNFPYHQILRKRAIGVRFGNIPSLIIPPKAFDFPRERNNNLFYVGLVNNTIIQRDLISERLKMVFEKIRESKKRDPETKFVYCSLGTVTGNYLKVCTNFFRNISKVCKRNFHLHIILSVGIYFDIGDLGSTPGNLYVFNHVPQLSVLRQCDFVITHGGMNTIFECIMAEKPVIVYPLSMDWDQNGNAARVAYHGIGLKGVVRRATPAAIERLLEKLIVDERNCKVNICRLKSKFEDRSQATLELINGFIKMI